MRMQRTAPARGAEAAPVPRRAQNDSAPPSPEAPTVRIGRSAPAPRASEPPHADLGRIGEDSDATKPIYPLRPPKHLSGPPDDLPTVRMPQRAAPPIVAPPPLPDAGGEERKTTVIYRRGRAEVVTAPPRPAEPGAAAPASDADPAILPARFSVFSPMLMTPGQWLDLAVYIHEPGIDSFVRRDHLARYEGKPGEIPERRSALRASLKPGAAVTVVPRLPGCRVNPPSATAEFWENFHRRSFRVMASPGAPDYAEGQQTGAVQFFVGPLLVGEARLAFTIGREKAHPISNTASLAADTFDAVFPAYAPQDGEIADRFAAVAAQVDNPFLAEILALRGRDWDREILKRIEAAERLQLFWSPAASRSPHLEEEWKFALALG
ncbi:MAG: toll/interleukin-1 receptor domain-containing protein, partial [Alphaproteobacteria bacterium]